MWNGTAATLKPRPTSRNDRAAMGRPPVVATVEAGEDVQRDRQDLDAEEHHDEVVGRRHQRAARGRQQ
jgi:hypothetical protein